MRKIIRNSESIQRTYHAFVHVNQDLILVILVVALVCNMVFVEGNSLFRSGLCRRLASASVMMWVEISVISGLQCIDTLTGTWLVPPGMSIWVWCKRFCVQHKSGLVLSWGHPGLSLGNLFGPEDFFFGVTDCCLSPSQTTLHQPCNHNNVSL